MKLSIIIPVYNETATDVASLIGSIENQVGVNFDDIETIIVKDHGKSNISQSGADFSIFPKVINNLRVVELEKNVGPGMARQAGIDAANGEYVMFCDADDILHNVAVIGVLFNHFANSPDIISTDWIEEIQQDDKSYAYLRHSNEATWMFGKAIRKQFLEMYGIRFHPDYRVHEDSLFLSKAYSMTNNRIQISDIVSYVWRFNPNSITRRDNGIYTYSAFDIFINAINESIKYLESKGSNVVQFKRLQMAIYVYFCIYSDHWLTEDKTQYRQKACIALYNMIKDYKHEFENANKQQFREVYANERRKVEGMFFEDVTFMQWLGLIYEKEGKLYE